MSDSPLIDHLLELRNRLLRAVLVIVAVFGSLAYFANDLYRLLAEPLIRHLPVGTQMIATDVAAPFFTPFKLTFVIAVALAVPFLLWQIWAFIAPGLYRKEKRLVVPLLASSTLLFYAGIGFAYFVVLPLAMGFFTSVAPADVAIATDISRYLDFVLAIFIAFGIAFETPVAIVLLIWSGVSTPDSLRKKRPYVIVGAFTLGMLLTPPDIISQTLLAVPMWLLFELGLIIGSFYRPTQKQSGQSNSTEE
ncbi:twin-arginine translocase subunit TatC [Idiomarina seosinensis]|uniref:Sec-independent protein translocase protein TatC n=1 Tax=Idiomarina seosinensis TaxID=281739 RepID=A0A432Z777_9GAMM|nr:twin-arginine translocase subunit TatC [Idiomarina seosinensis]RUO73695.1 twin-arginine translocase subunit TatC [Idiomarina seosinensis]